MPVKRELSYSVESLPDHVVNSLDNLITSLISHAHSLYERQDLGNGETVADATDKPKPEPKPNSTAWWHGPDDDLAIG